MWHYAGEQFQLFTGDHNKYEIFRNVHKMQPGSLQQAMERSWSHADICVVPGEAIECYDRKRDTDKLLLMVSG